MSCINEIRVDQGGDVPDIDHHNPNDIGSDLTVRNNTLKSIVYDAI